MKMSMSSLGLVFIQITARRESVNKLLHWLSKKVSVVMARNRYIYKFVLGINVRFVVMKLKDSKLSLQRHKRPH